VYNARFESAQLSELGAWLPEFERRIKTCAVCGACFSVVRKHAYHPGFAGPYSLKAVLRAIVPQISYESMEVANGADAGTAWESLERGA
jgi:succinate dehydrogenase/fumarate reductase-like Fe-S protein